MLPSDISGQGFPYSHVPAAFEAAKPGAVDGERRFRTRLPLFPRSGGI